MRFVLDTTSAIPIYSQLVGQVKKAIAAGVLQPGDSLPSLRELAGQLRVNPLTIAKGYRELERDGIISTEHGRGSFITAQVSDHTQEYRRQVLTQSLDSLLVEAFQVGATAKDVRQLLDERIAFVSSQHNEE